MATLTAVQLDATRSSDQPADVWTMRIRYTPHFSAGEKAQPTKHKYRVIARLRDQHGHPAADGLAQTSFATTVASGVQADLTVAADNKPQSLTFTVQSATMTVLGAFDGQSAARATVRPSVEIIDLDLNVSEDTQLGPELNLAVPLAGT